MTHRNLSFFEKFPIATPHTSDRKIISHQSLSKKLCFLLHKFHAECVSVTQLIFFVNDTVAPGKSSDLQSLLIFSFSSLALFILILIIATGGVAAFRFSLLFKLQSYTVFFKFSISLYSFQFKPLSAFSFNCTIIFEYGNLRYPF